MSVAQEMQRRSVTPEGARSNSSGTPILEKEKQKMMVSPEHIANIESEAVEEIASATDIPGLMRIRAGYLGKSGSVSRLLRRLDGMDPEVRGTAGRVANALKNRIEDLVLEKRIELVDPDYVNPEKLERLAQWVSQIPEDLTPDPDDPPPLV